MIEYIFNIWFKNWYQIALILYIMDIVTTVYGLKLGLDEENDFIKSLTPNINYNIILNTILNYVLWTFIYNYSHWLGDWYIDLANIVLSIINIIQLYIIVNNIYFIVKVLKNDKNN